MRCLDKMDVNVYNNRFGSWPTSHPFLYYPERLYLSRSHTPGNCYRLCSMALGKYTPTRKILQRVCKFVKAGCGIRASTLNAALKLMRWPIHLTQIKSINYFSNLLNETEGMFIGAGSIIDSVNPYCPSANSGNCKPQGHFFSYNALHRVFHDCPERIVVIEDHDISSLDATNRLFYKRYESIGHLNLGYTHISRVYRVEKCTRRQVKRPRRS